MNTALYEVLYVSTLATDQPLQVVAEIAAHARCVIFLSLHSGFFPLYY